MGGGRVHDAAGFVQELDAVAETQRAGAGDRVVEVGDDFGAGVIDALQMIAGLIAQQDRAAAGQRGGVGEQQFGDVADGVHLNLPVVLLTLPLRLRIELLATATVPTSVTAPWLDPSKVAVCPRMW